MHTHIEGDTLALSIEFGMDAIVIRANRFIYDVQIFGSSAIVKKIVSHPLLAVHLTVRRTLPRTLPFSLSLSVSSSSSSFLPSDASVEVWDRNAWSSSSSSSFFFPSSLLFISSFFFLLLPPPTLHPPTPPPPHLISRRFPFPSPLRSLVSSLCFPRVPFVSQGPS